MILGVFVATSHFILPKVFLLDPVTTLTSSACVGQYPAVLIHWEVLVYQTTLLKQCVIALYTICPVPSTLIKNNYELVYEIK